MSESVIKEKIKMELEPLEDICKKLVDRAKHSMENMDDVDTEEMGLVIDMIKDMSEAKKYVVEACYKKQIMEAMETSEYGEDYDEEGPKFYTQPRSQSSGRFMSRGDGRRNYGSSRMRFEPVYDDMMYYNGDGTRYYDHYRDMDRGYGRMYYSDSIRSTGTSTSTGSGMPRQNPNEVANDMGMESNEGNNRFYGDGNRSGRNDRMNYQESDYERSRRTYMEAKEKHNGNSVEDNKMKMDKLNELGDSLEDSLTELVNGMNDQEKKMWKSRIMSIGQNIK